jgi:UDP-glucose 4-epimerase
MQTDFASDQALSWITDINPAVIFHCAGTSLVGPSVQDPGLYYENNFVRTKRLLDHVIKNGLQTRIIFSSSAAVYGDPIITPCQEEDPPLPVSPYGESKLMIEMMMQSYHAAYGLDFVAFRYFNACGADTKARHGQEFGATHIIARVLESIRDGGTFTLHGDQYPTADGTCIRDYIHVEDIAQAHIMAMDTKVPPGIYNLGSNAGFSNRDVIMAAQAVTGKTVEVKAGPPRTGDPAVLTATFEKFKRITGWQPKHTVKQMIEHAWAWYVR